MPTTLWRNGDFLKLWISQAVSQVGSQVRLLALPLTAILTLDATPLEVGLLFAISGLPSLFIGTIAGAYIDRHRRRVILITADWGRAIIIGLVPLAYFLDGLQMWMLFIAAFGTGALSFAFEVAYRSYLPSLVERNQLVDANSKLEFTRSGGEVAGPAIGGGIIQIASAPVALLADAITFAASAIFLHRIRKAEPAPQQSLAGREPYRQEITAGFRLVLSHSLLRPLIVATALIGFFNAMIDATYLLYMSDELEVSAGVIGLIFGIGGLGLLVGAAVAGRLVDRFGIGRVLVLALLLVAVSDLALPLAGGPLPVIAVLLATAQIAFGIGLALFNISQVSLRQGVAEDRLLGRLNSVFLIAMVGTVPVGALAGGLIGEFIGLRQALFVGVTGEALAVIWLLASPLRSLRKLPETGDEH